MRWRLDGYLLPSGLIPTLLVYLDVLRFLAYVLGKELVDVVSGDCLGGGPLLVLSLAGSGVVHLICLAAFGIDGDFVEVVTPRRALLLLSFRCFIIVVSFRLFSKHEAVQGETDDAHD